MIGLRGNVAENHWLTFAADGLALVAFLHHVFGFEMFCSDLQLVRVGPSV